jgi:hypothetical protein
MVLFDRRPQRQKGDPLKDIDAQPEKTDQLRVKTPSTFVKHPMREKKGGRIVTFVGMRSGRVASQGERETGSDSTT